MRNYFRTQKTLHKNRTGLTLVELLVSITLMAFLSLFFVDVFLKSNVTSAAVNLRYKGVGEVQSLVQDIQKDLHQGAYISDNSHNKRLEYTLFDSNGTAVKKIYQIVTISGSQYIQLSIDGGTTWISPYRISNYDKYVLTGTPKFLYASSINNCTDFSDSSGDGIWTSGVDTAGSYLACSNGTSTPILNKPSQASKIDLSGFQITMGVSSPQATRTLLSDLFIEIAPGLVRSTVTPSAPAVKDPPLVQWFYTAGASTTFGTSFDIRTPVWDSSRRQLILVGQHTSGNNQFFLTDRRGVQINSPLLTKQTDIQADGAAITKDDNIILLLDAVAKKIYQLSTINSGLLRSLTVLNLGSPSNLINTPSSIAYDPATPSDFYVAGADPSTGAFKIYQRNIRTGTLVGTAWNLPAAFDASHLPTGMVIEPISRDFLVVRNYVNGSYPNKTIDIYRITRAGVSTSFSINIDDLGSSATGTNGNWGLGYDPDTNRIFLSDNFNDKLYEVVPDRLISPRS